MDLMRELYVQHKGDRDACVTEFAAALRSGKVTRKSNKNNETPENYANNLYHDTARRDGLAH